MLREQRIHEPTRMVTLVVTDTLGRQPLASLQAQQCQRRLRLRHAHPGRHAGIADQTMAVIHQGTLGEAQLGFLSERFAKQLRFRVRGARARVIAPPLTLGVSIPAGFRCRAAADLGSERLDRRPRLDQCAIDTEVLVRR